MRIVVPFTTLHPLTQTSVDRLADLVGRPARYWRLSPDPTAYWECLNTLWSSGEGWLNVEHDIEVNDLVYGGLACTNPWCVWPYPGAGQGLLHRSLGCTRFSSRLLADEPDLMAEVGQVGEGLPVRDWRRLDVVIANRLERRGYVACQHYPPVLHHHAYPEGCACGDNH